MSDEGEGVELTGPLGLVEVMVRMMTVVSVLSDMRGNLDGSFRDDTLLALGEALGVAVRAKALVERDMVDAEHARRVGDDAACRHGEDASGAG